MRDYIHIGSTPCEEDCAQVGSDNYREQSRNELRAFQNQILRVYPMKNLTVARHCSLGIRNGEVVCYYEDNVRTSLDYALKLEGSKKLHRWDETALSELGIASAQPTKLLRGEFVFVEEYPLCDLCSRGSLPEDTTYAVYDARTKTGPWANVCEKHFSTHTFGVLGTGRGQKYFLRVDKQDAIKNNLVEV